MFYAFSTMLLSFSEASDESLTEAICERLHMTANQAALTSKDSLFQDIIRGTETSESAEIKQIFRETAKSPKYAENILAMVAILN
jgi:hypothetical protein